MKSLMKPLDKMSNKGTVMTGVLHVKHMVCLRCIKTVRSAAEASGFKVIHVELGNVFIEGNVSKEQLEKFSSLLKEEEFELLDNKNNRVVSQIKKLIIEEIHSDESIKPERMNFSSYLSKEMGHDYSYLSKLFSSVSGQTIEKYIIAQKIERAKELLSYGQLSVGEISWSLGYSSSQHLSNQFRSVTGMSPLEFRQEHRHDRKAIDHV